MTSEHMKTFEELPFWIKLYDDLEAQLILNEKQINYKLGFAEEAVVICLNALQQLYQQILNYNFSGKHQEIHFFKTIKPKFYSRLIYYQHMFKIELDRPNGETKDIDSYLRKELKKLNRFFKEHKFFYQYYRSKADYLDEKFYVRNIPDKIIQLYLTYAEADPRFSTSHDFIFARIQANDLLQVYLVREILSLKDRTDTTNAKSVLVDKSLTWTESKTALIELIYGLQATGAFNNGKVDLKQLIDFFQTAFAIDLGNTSRTFQEILSRKTGYTNFIDKMHERLLQRIDKIEDKYIK